MLRYKTPNGKPVAAESLRGIAEVMWREMLIPEPTLEQWMIGSAQRAKDWNGAIIRTSSPEEHVQDLIDAGILIPVISGKKSQDEEVFTVICWRYGQKTPVDFTDYQCALDYLKANTDTEFREVVIDKNNVILADRKTFGLEKENTSRIGQLYED